MKATVHRSFLTIGLGTVLAVLTLGFHATVEASITPELSLSAAEEQVDTFAIFASNVDDIIRRYLSYNEMVRQLADEGEEENDVTVLGGYLDRTLIEVLQTSESPNPTSLSQSVQSLSVLSLGLDGRTFPVYQTLFYTEMERVRRGTLIKALPLTVPIDGATITSGFGMRNHPILRGRRMHKGLDMAAPTGTSIYATGGGTVVFSGRKNGYGNTIIIDHGHGYTTLYAHCSKLLVEEGAKISRGDLIALVGSTGRSTGPHLHYEVRVNGQHMNPEVFLSYTREQTEDLDVLADYYLTF
ncbi:MAG: M23 family metallopeptidase [Ignavibacteriae bacterium]|nr:M23 family metallopeptidase [Ignavibacteriota bacterium]